ncbi:MAG: hypothetical protein L3J00_08800 [Thiomicrorhabdus sp.]|nr:hypothetical protein [Thiomicrorhabdus sp.]
MRFFELEPSDISDLKFDDLEEMVARLCEAELIRQNISVACVLSGGASQAPDGGVDVRVKNASGVPSNCFIPRENTVFQVKKHSMSKTACKNEMLYRGGDVKPVIKKLAQQQGAYIIISGKDDCADKMLNNRINGMTEAVDDLPEKNDLLLDFYGRDRLSTWLREFPGVALWVRSKLGKPLSGWKPFGQWATPDNQDDTFLLDDHPCVMDANASQKDPVSIEDGIKLTRNKLRNNGCVRLIGLSGVGKTRFAQALFEDKVCKEALPTANVIYADLGEDLTPSASELVTYLIANKLSAYVVLDNCPPDVHRRLQKQMALESATFSLLTIEYDISDDRPEETEVILIEPSSEATVSKLIQKRFPALERINADKVADFSGGNARLAIALASRVEADETLTNFSDEALFKRLFHQRKEGGAESLLASAEVLSLVYSFNVSATEFNNELNVLANVSGLTRRNLYRDHSELLRRQLSQKRGDWRAILPHALANRLARRALENIPPEEINIELFKPENFRLFQSCAHRLGYLHDCAPARQLAKTWMQSGGPLHDIASCDARSLTILTYIAPVLPNTVLKAIEAASIDPVFSSRENKNFSVFVDLLSQIAYESESFDRAVSLMLKFAESERFGENRDSIVSQLQSLFKLYLSGTQATPEQRQRFLNRLLNSKKPRDLEIASDLFQSAFKTSHWSSFGGFSFGARSRNHGWEPKTNDEKLDWYVGFIRLLIPFLASEDEKSKKGAKELLANNFRGLWSCAGCFDILEQIVNEYASSGRWPEMWRSIKKTIFFDGNKCAPELRTRLDALENLAAPSDLYSEIEAYVFTNTWDHRGIETSDVKEKIIKLGERAAIELECLKKLAPRLWNKEIDSLWFFGKGFAKGSTDPCSTFVLLVELMQKQTLESVPPVLFSGFIGGVYDDKPELAQQFQEQVLEIPELKEYFICFLGATPIAPWGVKKIIELARAGEFEAWRFEEIRFGELHRSISDDDLFELFLALNDLKGGLFSTITILQMIFLLDDYIPNEKLRSVGRQAILKILAMPIDEISQHQWHDINRVVKECLSGTAPKNEVVEIIGLLCKNIESYCLYCCGFEKIMDDLIKIFPEIILSYILENNEDCFKHIFFNDSFDPSSSSLNLVPVERLVNWCNGDENRIQKVAMAISVYSPVTIAQPMEHPKQVRLSSHIKSFLDIAKNKADIIESIVFGMAPTGGFVGTFADIHDIRLQAFKELLEHDSPEVQKLARIKIPIIEESIRNNRASEAKERTRYEQRFE